MFDWFEKLVREAIWKALNDFFNDLAALAEAKIIEKLQSLTAGQQLSTTPLIRVTGVDLAADTFQYSSVLPLPIPAHVNRTITIGVQHVADGGVQGDFVTSPIVLPAISP